MPGLPNVGDCLNFTSLMFLLAFCDEDTGRERVVSLKTWRAWKDPLWPRGCALLSTPASLAVDVREYFFFLETVSFAGVHPSFFSINECLPIFFVGASLYVLS